MFWSAGCSLLRAEGFSCSLGLLYGGLRISKLQFLGHQTLDPDPESGSAIGKYAGSGSVSGSALNRCGSATLTLTLALFQAVLWIRIREFLRLPDQSLFVRIQLLPSSSKKVRKNLISSIVYHNDFLSLKTAVNVPSKSTAIGKKTKKEKLKFVGILKTNNERAGSGSVSVSQCPDSHQNVTDPQHWFIALSKLRFGIQKLVVSRPWKSLQISRRPILDKLMLQKVCLIRF